jgi:hypothetical protein
VCACSPPETQRVHFTPGTTVFPPDAVGTAGTSQMHAHVTCVACAACAMCPQGEWVAGSTSWYPRGLPLSRLRGREMCGARWQTVPPEVVSDHRAQLATAAAHNSTGPPPPPPTIPEDRVLIMVFQDVAPGDDLAAPRPAGAGAAAVVASPPPPATPPTTGLPPPPSQLAV